MADAVGLGSKRAKNIDADVYGGDTPGYAAEIADGGDTPAEAAAQPARKTFTAPKGALAPVDKEEEEAPRSANPNSIGARTDEYRAQAFNRMLSPERADPFAAETPMEEVRTYKDVMQEAALEKEKAEVMRKIREQQQEAQENGGSMPAPE